MQALSTMNTGQLVAVYNERAEKPIKSWKSGKDKLVAKIEALPAVTHGTVTGRMTPAAATTDADYKAAITAAAISPRDSIQVASEKLLEAVAYKHDGRNWGIPYDAILAEIKTVFPDCKTTVACLRWYAVKMNEAGGILPKRKRSASK